MVKKPKLWWFGHVSMFSGLAKTILQGTVNGKRRRGRQKKRREDNIQGWTEMGFASLIRTAESKKDKVERDCCEVVCDAPAMLWDR